MKKRESDKAKTPEQQSQSLQQRPDGKVQGEGDYESARRYGRDVKSFVENADIERAAREAAPRDQREAQELEAAEEAGRARAKGKSKPPPR